MTLLSVPDMNCGHCKASVTAALTALDATARIAVDLDKREVAVETAADPAALIKSLQDIGFPAQVLSAD